MAIGSSTALKSNGIGKVKVISSGVGVQPVITPTIKPVNSINYLKKASFFSRFLSSLKTNPFVKSPFSKNPLGLLLTAGSIGYSLYSSYREDEEIEKKEIEQQAESIKKINEIEPKNDPISKKDTQLFGVVAPLLKKDNHQKEDFNKVFKSKISETDSIIDVLRENATANAWLKNREIEANRENTIMLLEGIKNLTDMMFEIGLSLDYFMETDNGSNKKDNEKNKDNEINPDKKDYGELQKELLDLQIKKEKFLSEPYENTLETPLSIEASKNWEVRQKNKDENEWELPEDLLNQFDILSMFNLEKESNNSVGGG